MKSVIHRYGLDPTKTQQILRLPHGAKVLSVAFHKGTFSIWAVHITEADVPHVLGSAGTDDHQITIVGTGNEFEGNPGDIGECVGIVIHNTFVFHIFDRRLSAR